MSGDSMWAMFSEDERKRWLDWVVGTCLLAGSTFYTAYSVAGLLGAGLDRELVAIGAESSP